MKHEITETRVEETDRVPLEDLKIKTMGENGPTLETLGLDIGNWPDQGLLILYFKRNGGKIFKITIDNGQISFERNAYRSSHDHDDTQELSFRPEGGPPNLSWLCPNDSRVFKANPVKIPFGDTKLSY